MHENFQIYGSQEEETENLYLLGAFHKKCLQKKLMLQMKHYKNKNSQLLQYL